MKEDVETLPGTLWMVSFGGGRSLYEGSKEVKNRR